MALFALGKLGAPFGVAGEIKLYTHSGESAHLLGLDYLELRNSVTSVTLPVERVRSLHAFALIKFKGIDSPESAKGYVHYEAWADERFKAPVRPGEFYISDLIGLTLVSAEGERLGDVVGVCDTNHDDMLEVKLDVGATRLVPFRKQFIGDVDLDAKRLVLLERWILE
jgi:16S rRNA processing protein RimM